MSDPATVDSLNAALSDRYRVERELGAGGMATVYLAHDLRHDRKVALKVLRGDLAASLGPERFHREIRVAAALQHPHIVPLYDSGTAGSQLFYVMPFVEGQSLRQKLLKAGELPVADAVRILRDVAEALTEAHRHGVVHRDLKPENIMLSGRHALVTDFGVAKAVSESTGRQTLTTLGVALGTPSYMAPEQATADPNTDHRADIYAFGVLAYELLAGRPPFHGGSPQEVLAAHVTQAAEPVTNVRPAVPPVLAGLVMKCLEKRPADRWQSAEELIPTLEAVLTPSGGMAPTTAATPTASHQVSGRRLSLGVAAVAVIAALGGAAWFAFGRAPATATPNAARIAVAWLDNRTGDAALDDVGALAAEWIINGLASQRFGELVSSTEVRELLSGELAASPSRARDLASRTNAGILVSGSYFKRGDSLEYRAEMLNVADGALIASVGPFRGTSEATAPLDSLFERIAVVIGDRLFMGDYAAYGRPTNLAAWRAYQTGVETFVRSQASSVPHFNSARELDSGWASPYFYLWAVHQNAGRPHAADSILAVAAASPLRLTSADRLSLEYCQVTTAGNEERAYSIRKQLAKETPRQEAYLYALNAVRTGRPREALEQVALRDTTFFSREWGGWTSVQRSALHLLERFEEELGVAREVTRARGVTLGRADAEVNALAALGRVREVDSLLARVWEEPVVGALAPADLAETAGWEYLAHGFPEPAAAAFKRRLDWYLSRSPEQRTRHTAFAQDLAQAYFQAGRYAEARAMFDSLSRALPANEGWLGMLGVTGALMNNRTFAMDVDARLAAMDRKYIRGAHHLWRGRIAALLGDCPRAVEMLRSTLGSGQPYNAAGHHRYASLGRARECTGLREALKPRG